MIVYSILDELFFGIEFLQLLNLVLVLYECCLKYRLIFVCFKLFDNFFKNFLFYFRIKWWWKSDVSNFMYCFYIIIDIDGIRIW